MNDAVTTVADMKQVLRQFVDQRDWSQFHAPKNLAMSLAIEAAELMEHFQWIDVAESRQLQDCESRKAEIADEIADVLCYTLAIANVMDVDLADAFEKKMAKNRVKYPAEEFQGRWGRQHQAESTPGENNASRNE